MQQVIAFLFWAWTVDRAFIVGRYVVQFTGDQPWQLEVWTISRHISLLVLEISFYALAITLMGAPVKKWLRDRLKGLLDG